MINASCRGGSWWGSWAGITKATQRACPFRSTRDDLGVGNAGARFELVLDLAGRDKEAAEPHGVARAGFVDEGAVGAQPADIAGAEEAVRGDGVACRLGIVVVTEEARRRADLDLAGDTLSRGLAGLGVAHAHPRVG
ncbi:hypothetical protein ACVWYI_006895 [Bradyrhizobium sp. LB13.1]